MDWFVRAFLKASLAWFAAAVLLALAMALIPALTVYRVAHMHLALLGFVTQMIYGVALHVIPRFVGHPLRHRRMAEVQFVAAQIGLALLAAGFAARVHGWGFAAPALAAGGLLSALGASCFVVNLWLTMDAGDVKAAKLHARPAGRAMPLMPQAAADE